MLRNLRYLTFEVNNTCNLTTLHTKCPISDPERYSFGEQKQTLTDESIFNFWLWAAGHGFQGIVLWHLYNEPSLVLPQIQRILAKMRIVLPGQRSHLWTNSHTVAPEGFDHVQLTDYTRIRPNELDNRRASTRGVGLPYERVRSEGSCGRGFGWEVIIDHFGNWLLCCNDWRAECSFGNIFSTKWDTLLERYVEKSKIEWHDEDSYDALPRMCRSCMEVNPNLHRSALPPPHLQTKW